MTLRVPFAGAALPGRDGFALVDVVRARGDAGVVVVADDDELDDRLRRPGVDVHVVTPVRRAELVSRVHAALRRRGRLGAALRVGDLVIDDGAGTATRNGASLALTATELRLLRCLADRRGWTVGKDQLLQQVWGYGRYAPNLVEVHLCALRRKLEVHGPRIVHTRRGLGYVLRPAGETVP